MIVGWALVLAGCATPPPTTRSGEEFSRVSILDEDDADGRLAYYLVEADTLSFAGGRAAMRETPETTQALDVETMASIVGAIQDAGWLSSPPPASLGTGPRSVSIDITWKGGRRTLRIQAEGRRLPPKTDAVVVLLKEIADRRFKGLIESLPRGR